MPFTGKVGDTFFRNDPGGGHTCVIITPPNKYKKIVVVNFTEHSYYKECIVSFTRSDDKSLFTKKTTVDYGRTKFIDQKKTTDYVARNSRVIRPYCQPHILKEIIKGAFLSQEIAGKFIKELRKHYPTEYDTYYSEDG